MEELLSWEMGDGWFSELSVTFEVTALVAQCFDADDNGICDLALGDSGCNDSTSCNYTSYALEGVSCVLPTLECGCSSIPEGKCDCEGNVLDACGVCGGDGVDVDDDGICDDVDDCVGQLDECGVCNGTGIPEGWCNCDGTELVPDGFCDCEGNVFDECGVCGGIGPPGGYCDCEGNVPDACGVCGGEGVDEDDDGICDDVDDCIGQLDECGVCNGTGFPKGGATAKELSRCQMDFVLRGQRVGRMRCLWRHRNSGGYCDCEGNVDLDNDGICDDEDDCVGDFDECGCATGSEFPKGPAIVKGIADECGVCGGSSDECGCTDPEACNYTPDASVEDGSGLLLLRR